MLKHFSPRPYQKEIFNSTLNNNTLVVLPTGLGKTAIAMMVAARRMLNYPNKKIVFLAPTKPLVEQQCEAFKKSFFVDKNQFTVFTGHVAPEKRIQLWNNSTFIFSTPQTLENDVLSKHIDLNDVSLLIIDEAHRATGDYAYVFIAEQYAKTQNPRLIALTASPGADQESIDTIIKNLYIEKVEYRKPNEKEVLEYTKGTDVSWLEVRLPETLEKISTYLTRAYNQRLNQLKEIDIVKTNNLSKIALLKLQRELHTKITQGQKEPEYLKGISLLAQCMKVLHAIELSQTQTLHALHEYLYGILEQSRTTKTKAIKALAIDPNVLSALSLTRDLKKQNQEHPKLILLKEQVAQIVKEKPTAKIIVFAQFRDTAMKIKDELNVSSSLFFGQAKKNGVGFSQKQQKEVLDQFKNNEFSTLIATSVAEEGLDIPSVDHVFFYEPVPSAIRSVQRRGRTGRHTRGFCTVLITKGTKDEASRWVAHHKEKRMYGVLGDLTKQNKELQPIKQVSLDEFKPKLDIKIIADHREKGSPVLKSLLAQNIDLELRQLSVGDFVLSKECCVEFKNYSDFVDSIVDGRLLGQLKSLSQYSKPLVIIEGQQELHRKVSQEAIDGMLATIAISYKIPVLRTFSPLETTRLLITIAKAEQLDEQTTFTFHTAKPLSKKEQLEYIVSSFPSIGGALAKALLVQFDTLQNILNATIEDLKNIPLIGEKKAQEVHDTLRHSYKAAKEDRY